MHHIEIEDMKTWPDAVKRLLTGNLNLLFEFIKFENTYPDLPEPKRSFANNPYKEKYNSIVNALDEILHGCKLIGYHCTRLLDNEINEIKNQGLDPASPELLLRKINHAIKADALSQDVGEILLRKNGSSESSRKDKLYFVVGISTLKNKNAVEKLFSTWGGELIHNYHPNDAGYWSTIESIGKPCIFKVALSLSDLSDDPSYLSKKIILSFLKNKLIDTPNNPQFDACMKKPLLAENILKVITSDEEEFSILTI